MRKTLKWVATENNLSTLFNKDVYATVEENNYKGIIIFLDSIHKFC